MNVIGVVAGRGVGDVRRVIDAKTIACAGPGAFDDALVPAVSLAAHLMPAEVIHGRAHADFDATRGGGP